MDQIFVKTTEPKWTNAFKRLSLSNLFENSLSTNDCYPEAEVKVR